MNHPIKTTLNRIGTKCRRCSVKNETIFVYSCVAAAGKEFIMGFRSTQISLIRWCRNIAWSMLKWFSFCVQLLSLCIHCCHTAKAYQRPRRNHINMNCNNIVTDFMQHSSFVDFLFASHIYGLGICGWIRQMNEHSINGHCVDMTFNLPMSNVSIWNDALLVWDHRKGKASCNYIRKWRSSLESKFLWSANTRWFNAYFVVVYINVDTGPISENWIRQRQPISICCLYAFFWSECETKNNKRNK